MLTQKDTTSLLDAMSALLSAYAEIDETLDGFELKGAEKKKQKSSNTARDKALRVYQKMSAKVRVTTDTSKV
jgi:hypothetical protein